MHALRQNLPIARAAAERTQADLGSAVGYSGAWVSQIENGDLLPRVDLLSAIAADLGTTVGELLGEDVSDSASVDRALPGWSRLDAAQQANVRGIVLGLAGAALRRVADGPGAYEHGLDPQTIAAAERAHLDVEAQDEAERGRGKPDDGAPPRRSARR